MTDAAPEYVLPPRDEELDALIGIPLTALDEESPLHDGAIVEATVTAHADDLELEAHGRTLIAKRDDARDLHGQLPAVGSTLRVLVEAHATTGPIAVSVDKVRQLDRLDALHALRQRTDAVRGMITVARRNGFSVDIEGFRAFLPGDQSGIPREDAFEAIGNVYDFHIHGFDAQHLELIVTRKSFADAERHEAFRRATTALSVGKRLEATVTRTTSFGAFVDLDGAEGLLHISEMALERVDANAMPVQVGDRVTVQVVEIDEERQRIRLSRRDILLDEQRAHLEAIAPNSLVEGTVSGLTDFGAFVTLDNGLRGLCHISELSWTERVNTPADVLSLGERVTMRVVAIDPAEGRMSLSLRQATDNPWSRFIETTPEGTQLDAQIIRVEDKGLVVAVNDDLQGFVRLSDLSWTIRAETPSDVRPFEVGETLTLSLLQADPQRQRILLGLKQVDGDPWDDAGEKTTVGHIFTATVSRFSDNAAFFELAPGLEARMHISEISVERVESVRAALRIGQEVEVMTVHADRTRRRIDLSIKAVEAKRLADQPRAYADEGSFGGMAEALRASGLSLPASDESSDT